MLASHAWLKELSGIDADPAEVASRLTSAGIEVEDMRRVGEGLQGVVVAEVRATRPHPKRDKLQLVTVFDGREQLEVVCGAPNVPVAGGRVLLAQLGATLPGGLEIAERDLGGVVSRGMLCSERELGVGSDESGILVLDPTTVAQPGASASRALALGDVVFELSLTPNRPDCLGHVGLSRELCALFDVPFAFPKTEPGARVVAAEPALWPQREQRFALASGALGSSAGSGFAPLRVEVADGARCPRYGAALVFGVTIGRSPFWLRHRLHVLGLRAISNVVDATNFLLMLWGHPLHAFDYDRLRGSRIDVRLAREGERMRTLDGEERALSADDLLICDGEGPVALAGVMGGEGSQIGDATQRILIECAYFDPRSVRRTSKRTGLHTDSSHRFERGVDPAGVRRVLTHAASLIANLGGGTLIADGLDVVAAAVQPRRIVLRTARLDVLLGKRIEPAIAAKQLRAIGCVASPTSGGFDVEAPSHRPDIGREVDLIEEIARLSGYDSLPSQLPRIVPSAEGTPAPIHFLRALRATAAAAGLTEAINYAFVAPHDLRNARAPELALRIVNPMSEERCAMRTSLLPGLAANLRHAQHQQQKSFAYFELARVFRPRAGQALPDELHQLGLLLWGQRRSWYAEGEVFELYDAKAAVEAVVRPLSGRLPETLVDASLDRDAPELHPRRNARIVLAGQAIGVIGELHPEVVASLGLEGRPVWAVLEVAALSQAIASVGPSQASALPRFPSATRDLAVVVPEATAAGEVAAALQAAAGPKAESVTLFDIYRGEPVDAGQKSLAFHVVYRDSEATLTDAAVDALHARVAQAAEQRFGGSVRR
jgi:phenylalanyl-tRNA synthetase beta chain